MEKAVNKNACLPSLGSMAKFVVNLKSEADVQNHLKAKSVESMHYVKLSICVKR